VEVGEEDGNGRSRRSALSLATNVPNYNTNEQKFDCLARILEVLSGARALVTRDLGSRAPV